MTSFIVGISYWCVSLEACVLNVSGHSIPEFPFSFTHILSCRYDALDKVNQSYGVTVSTQFDGMCVTGKHAFEKLGFVHSGPVVAVGLLAIFYWVCIKQKDRKWLFLNKNDIEDEFHYLLICPFFRWTDIFY